MMAVVHVLLLILTLSLTGLPAQAATDAFDEGLFEDVLPGRELPKAKPTEWMITVNADVKVHYTFADPSQGSFKVTYHIQLGGPLDATTVQLRGNAKIKTEIDGYLAKWGSGQCLLQVSIGDVPYEMSLAREDEDKLRLGLQFKQKILEDWQSLCTFLDAPDSRFYTRGEPERWIGEALQKASPSLDKLTVEISDRRKTEATFRISKHATKDGSIGSAEIEGSGTVTLTPPTQPPEEKK